MVEIKSVLCIFVTCLRFSVVFGESDDDPLRVTFTEGSKSCDDFENDKIKCNLEVTTDSEFATLKGTIDIKQDIDNDDELFLEVWKETDMGTNDPLFNCVASICGSMADKDTPWFPIFESMGIESCPVVAGTYNIDGVYISLNFADGMLTRKYKGKYVVELSTTAKLDKTSCHKFGMELVEIED